MGKWDGLTNEMLLEVMKIIWQDSLYKSEKHHLYQYMLVNKQWFSIAYSIIYQDIVIEYLDFSDKLFDTILHSSYQPGKWVRCITLKRLTVPDNFINQSPDSDPLHLLMTHCPQVKAFGVPYYYCYYSQGMNWAYFLNVLVKNGNWELQSLPDYSNGDMGIMDYAYYFNCAYYLRDCLTKFNLKAVIMMGGNYSYLKDFTKLTELRVDDFSALKSFNDFGRLMNYLPHLTTAYVTFNEYGGQEVNLRESNDGTQEYGEHRNLQKIQLENYTHPGDQDFLNIMNKFTQLDSVSIRFAGEDIWPTPVLCKCIRPISHRIFSSTNDDIRFLENYYTTLVKDIEQDHHSLRITFNELGFIIYNGEPYPTEIIISNDGSDLQLGYETESLEEAKTSIAYCGNYVQKVDIGMGTMSYGDPPRSPHNASQVETYLDIINSSCPNMRDVTITNIKCFDSLPNHPFHLGAQRLKLSNTYNITASVLPLLSANFPVLESMTFASCHIRGFHQTFDMRNTVFDTFCVSEPRLSLGDCSMSDIIPINMGISIISVDQGFSKYYICSGKNQYSEISKQAYISMSAVSSKNNATKICVIVKSVKKFFFSKGCKSCCIEFP